MNNVTSTEHIARFLEVFNVKIESPAIQYVYFDEGHQAFGETEPEKNGETSAVYVERRDMDGPSETLLILTDCNEHQLIEELSQQFDKFDYDVAAVIEYMQITYKDDNEL